MKSVKKKTSYDPSLALLTALLICAVVCITAQTVRSCDSDKSVDSKGVPYRIQYEKEAELAYWDARYRLNCSVQDYIDSVAPTSNLRAYDVIELTSKYDIELKFVLAQAEIESHFGTRGLASRTNSVWNVGAYDGLSESDIHSKHKYQHPNESIEPYLKLLTTKYLVGGKLEVDLMKSFTTKGGSRYASAKDYEPRLKICYEYISSHTNIDELVELMRYYAIKCGRS